MDKARVRTQVAALAALLGAVAFILAARHAPRFLSAFDQAFCPLWLALLVIALPVSVWQCRQRQGDVKWLVVGYGAATGVLVTELACVPALLQGPAASALARLGCIGIAYGLLQITIARLAEERLYVAALALLLSAATGIADLCRSNRVHGSVYGIVEWTV